MTTYAKIDKALRDSGGEPIGNMMRMGSVSIAYDLAMQGARDGDPNVSIEVVEVPRLTVTDPETGRWISFPLALILDVSLGNGIMAGNDSGGGIVHESCR